MRAAGLVVAALTLTGCQAIKSPSGKVSGPPASSSATSYAATHALDPPPTVGRLEPRETRLIARMLARVQAARGFKAIQPVPGVVLGRTALIERVKQHLSRELPREAIRNEGLALQLFGFVPVKLDYEAAQYGLLQAQLAGYYEPADGTMYMASDLGGDDADATLAHELVHALQDQRWRLEERSRYRPGQGDRSEAMSALAEGDATSAMFDVMISSVAPGSGKTALDVPDEVFAAQIRQGMGPPDARAPHIMLSSLAAPYIYGTLFVNALRRRGGWSAVDAAWDDTPTTSEQILHVDKWLAREPPLNVAEPTFAALGPGWTVLDSDSEGEIGVRVAFEEWMDAASAAEVSVGWGGDRGVLLASANRAAFAWRLRYDPGGERAAHAYAAIAAAFDRGLGSAHPGRGDFYCRERVDRGPIAVARASRDLVFVFGPANAGAGGWASAGDCALARRWTREIAATP